MTKNVIYPKIIPAARFSMVRDRRNGSAEVVAEKRESAGASEGGGFRVVAGAHVAVEAVAGVFVPVDFHLGVSGVDFLDLLGGDVGVELAEVELDGGVGRF